MRRPLVPLLLALCVVIGAGWLAPQRAVGADATVRGVLFFAPTCGHCELVIAGHLPGIFEQFGEPHEILGPTALDGSNGPAYLMRNDALELLLVDVSGEVGAGLFEQDAVRLGLASAGVPRLDIGREHLVGSRDIPDRLPGIVRSSLAKGGLDWPDVPDIDVALAGFADSDLDSRVPSSGDVSLGAVPDPVEQPFVAGLRSDPLGNGLAVVVLTILLASLLAVPFMASRGRLPRVPTWLTPALALVGIGVSAYLAFVEVGGGAAVCGPIGDCNSVQQSVYATILGVPIGVLGLVAYSTVLVAWIASRAARGRTADVLMATVAAIAWCGTAFSVYLTFLEPFVIGATCMWCLTSALTIAGLLWATAGLG